MASRTCKMGSWVGMGDTHCLDMMEYDTVSDITKNTIDSIHDSFAESLYKLDNTKSVIQAASPSP